MATTFFVKTQQRSLSGLQEKSFHGGGFKSTNKQIEVASAAFSTGITLGTTIDSGEKSFLRFRSERENIYRQIKQCGWLIKTMRFCLKIREALK